MSLKFKNVEEVTSYAKQQNKTLVIYDDLILDVGDFMHNHPGGSGLVLAYKQKNISSEMNIHHPLSKDVAQSLCIGTFDSSVKRVIDPQQPLLPQIWNMDHQTYLDNVHRPKWVFSRSPRMFASSWMEKLSYCSWYNIFFVPYLILFAYYKRYVQDNWVQNNIFTLCMIFTLGIFVFSFTEYMLHRFLFHSEKRLLDLRAMRYVHFCLHGIHHMFPFDPYRLVLPPSFTALIIGIGYLTVYQLSYWTDPVKDLIFWTGFLTGYVMYDLTHYAIHHIDTSKNKRSMFHVIQQHHNQHHYGGEDAGYGVSTPFWDHIFGSLFTTKKHV